MPTTILDGETYEEARYRRFSEEAEEIEKMTQDEIIIAMAREAGSLPEYCIVLPKDLERFFNLAFAAGAAHEREKYDRIKDHLSDAEEIIQRMMREREAAVLAEREACAKVCESGVNMWPSEYHEEWNDACEDRAAAIRARS